MATIRVRSTDGNDADDGTTWALAKATLTGAAAIDAAGDTIAVSSVHAESTAAALNFAWGGTLAAPTRILSVNDAADPPTALAAGATVTTTGANAIQLASSANAYVYWSGITFNCGTGTSAANITFNGRHLLDDCSLFLVNTNAGSSINLSTSFAEMVNCKFKFADVGQTIKFSTGSDRTHFIQGGQVVSGGANITTLLAPTGSGGGVINLEEFDFSALSASVDITATAVVNVGVDLRFCILPASWTGSLNSAVPGIGSVFDMYSCWSGATEIIWRRKLRAGEGRDETTLVRTAGGKHRGVGVSLKCDTNADAEYPLNTFDTLQFAAQVTAAQVGSPVTATVEILHDSATAMTDADIWLTVVGPEDEVNSDQVADVFATPANQAPSSATWTTTGMANPNTQKLTVTWTPAKAGVVLGTVSIAAASKTVYVDNMMTVAP